jgi:F-type H+-transporting ATPase subunit b
MLLATSLLSASMSLSAHALGAAPKGGVTVDLDLTFLWSSLLFVVLVLVLKPLLFDPMLRLFEERDRRIEGTKAAARQLDDAATEALGRYEGEMKKARAEGGAEREARRAEGHKLGGDVLAKVREETSETVNVGRQQLQREETDARAALQSDAQGLARAMASRVLGREVQG